MVDKNKVNAIHTIQMLTALWMGMALSSLKEAAHIRPPPHSKWNAGLFGTLSPKLLK